MVTVGRNRRAKHHLADSEANAELLGTEKAGPVVRQQNTQENCIYSNREAQFVQDCHELNIVRP